jgi:hypothetical protein
VDAGAAARPPQGTAGQQPRRQIELTGQGVGDVTRGDELRPHRAGGVVVEHDLLAAERATPDPPLVAAAQRLRDRLRQAGATGA